jgi:hypothetical protein
MLPPGIVAVGPDDPRIGTIQLARVQRIERGVAFIRTLCDLPVQRHWHSQEIAGRVVCRECLAKLEGVK